MVDRQTDRPHMAYCAGCDDLSVVSGHTITKNGSKMPKTRCIRNPEATWNICWDFLQVFASWHL